MGIIGRTTGLSDIRASIMTSSAKGAPRIITLMAALLGMVGPFSPALAQEKLLERGRDLAEQHCVRCHAIGHEDESRLPQAPPLRELRNRYPVENLAEAFAEGIVTAHPAMPEFSFETPQIEALLAYIDNLGKAEER